LRRIRIGNIQIDNVTMEQAIGLIERLAKDHRGGYVVTPNVDHVVMAEQNEEFLAAYVDATLSLADGMPILWLSRLLGYPLQEKVSGSDLVRPLLRRVASSGLSVYLLGAAPGVGLRAAEVLKGEIPGLRIAGVDSPPIGFEKDPEAEEAVYSKMLGANPDIVLVALGAPKQEIMIHRWREKGAPQVMLGIGASIDFIAGISKRAPLWMSNIGAEWLFRLAHDPIRLGKRYLVRDLKFFRIAYRTLRAPRDSVVSS